MVFTEWLQTYVPITLGILSILGIILGFIAQVTKKFQKLIKDEVTEMAKEFKPNGGSTLKDQVNRLESGHSEIEKDIKDLKKDLSDNLSDVKKDNQRLENKLDKMFDTVLKVIDKFNK